MPVPVILSQETLAEMIRTTRSRVRFFMNKFSNKGIHL
jgi:CRP/FNR family transcriptional regulator, cyclic AMP receptor protein